jgi:hypothetical protein
MKKEEFGKLWLEYQEWVSSHNRNVLKRAEKLNQKQIFDEGLFTIGDGWDGFIAWCTGKYDHFNE